MKRFTLAAVCGSLLFVAALQAQTQLQPMTDPGFSDTGPTPVAVELQPFAQPQPDDLKTFPKNVVPQPGTGPKDIELETPAELKKYPIWLLIKPDGVQFLQTQEEIATNFHTIPPHAFLLGCVTANFKAAAVDQQPNFQLACEDFLLRGRYGSKQNLDVKGAALNFSTKTHQIQFQGSEEIPLELHSVDVASETRMQADEIILQLDDSPINETRYVTMSVVDPKTGRQSEVKKPVVELIARRTSFQISAKNITSLETIATPANTTGTDAPMWDPTPQPIPEDAPVYEDPGFNPVRSRKPRSDVSP